jgi:hypothetical protein
MVLNEQEHESDPIIAALGIDADDPSPEVFPTDTVYGYYEDQGPIRFRLWLKNVRCFMSHFKERIVVHEGLSGGGTKLVLRADGDYRGELVIACPPEPSNPGGSKDTFSALYANYAVPETTPWHEW